MAFFLVEALAISYCIDYLRKNETACVELTRNLNSEWSANGKIEAKEEKIRGLMHQLAVTEERERRQLAAELHDYLAQL